MVRYLAAYGPATAADMTKWSMVTRLGPVFTAMAKAGRLTTYVDGLLSGLWRTEDGSIRVEPFRSLTRSERRGLALDEERIATLLAR